MWLLTLFSSFLQLVQHRFASHCVETLFLTAAPLVTKEILGELPDEVDFDDDEEKTKESKINFEDLFLSALHELEGNMGYLMTESFASHTLRVLLVVLSGRPLTGTKTTSILQSKAKKKFEPESKPTSTNDTPLQRAIPESFNAAVDEMFAGITSGLDTHYLRAMATNPLANPVLQLFLEIEFSKAGKQKAKDNQSLYRKLLPDDPLEEGTESVRFIKGLLYDPIGSRLLETIIQHAPGKAFKSLHRALFKENLASIAKNDVAGYVVIKVVERMSKEDLKEAVEKISPEIPVLVEKSRTSVIKALIERCRVRGIDTKTIAEGVEAAYGSSKAELLVKMLRPTPGNEDLDPEHKAQVDAQDSSKLHTSLLAQAMLAASDKSRELITDSFLTCDLDTVLSIAKDRTASYVLQEALKCSGQSKAFRRKMLQLLTGSVIRLALHAIGSHVVDAMWTASDDLQFIREKIAAELSADEARLRNSFSGRVVWRNWMMDLYNRRRTEWIANCKSDVDATAAPVERGPQFKAKSGIELARERFAAKKSGRGGQVIGRQNGRGGLAVK